MHLNSKEVSHLKEVFKSLDHNKDGHLQLDELKTGLADMANGDEILGLLQAVDTDRSGTINYTGKSLASPSLEFLAATIEA